MLESVISEFLLRYLGVYFRDLNSEKLKVAIWSGVLELRNIELRKEALAQAFPGAQLRQGAIGRLSLTVPWSNLRSKPVVLSLERVCAVFNPCAQQPRSNSSSAADERAAKQTELARVIAEMYEKRRDALEPLPAADVPLPS
jgi:vacuolar protein sorting-associated protein 13A/C